MDAGAPLSQVKTLQTSIVEPQNGASFQSMDVARALFDDTE